MQRATSDASEIQTISFFKKKKKKVFLAVMAIGKDFLFSIDLLLKELSWNQINSSEFICTARLMLRTRNKKQPRSWQQK